MDSIIDKPEVEILDSSLQVKLTQQIENSFYYVRDLIDHKSEDTEVLGLLEFRCNQGEHDFICKGLTYGVLAGYEWFNYLFSVSKDQFHSACSTLLRLAPRMKNPQMGLGLLEQLWRTNCVGFPDLLLSMIRIIDLSHFLSNQIDWVACHPVAGFVLYRLLREDMLVKNEVVWLVTGIWRRNLEGCLAVGRDLLRVLNTLTETSGIEIIWNDLYSGSSDGSPIYWSVLCTPTNPKYHSMLVFPLVESKVIYLIENVKPSYHSRYLEWVAGDCNECVFPDLVRFVVTYPPNKEVTPRWQIAGWFLSKTQNHQLQAYIKQALVFDCLFFNKQDQLYTIEPAMSLLKYSISKCPAMAEEILEFMLTSAELYDKRSTAAIMRSLKQSFKVSHSNGIIPSIDSLVNDERLDEGIRNRLAGMLEGPSNGSDIVPSPLLETDEIQYTSAPKALMEGLGELGTSFCNEPSLKGIKEMMSKTGEASEDLANFVTGCLSFEFGQSVSLQTSENSLLCSIFKEAEKDLQIKELLKIMYTQESAVGSRLLVYSLLNNVSLYQQVGEDFKRDLKVSLSETNQEVLDWLFPQVFRNLNNLVTPSIIEFFLQSASSELICKIELDLFQKSYSLLCNKLPQVLERSKDFSSTEQLYLWKLIQAEIKPEKLEVILSHFQEIEPNDFPPYESSSGLINYLLLNSSHITARHLKLLLELPTKVFKGCIYAVLTKLKSAYVQEASVEILQNEQVHFKLNLLKHMKFWVSKGGKPKEIVFSESLQNCIFETLKKDFVPSKFNCLLNCSIK